MSRVRRDVQLVQHNGFDTAKNLGLSDDVANRFQKHWNRFFWAGKNIQHDKLIPELAKRVRSEAASGKEIFYVTGRTKKLQSATLRQLQQAGLPYADRAHLVMKQNVGVKTLPWKLEQAKALRLSSYATESARDTDAMIQEAGVRGVYSDFAMKPHGPEGPKSTANLEVIVPRSTYRTVRERSPSRRSTYRTARKQAPSRR